MHNEEEEEEDSDEEEEEIVDFTTSLTKVLTGSVESALPSFHWWEVTDTRACSWEVDAWRVATRGYQDV